MKEKILIVDDEERMRRLIAAYMTKEGYEVYEAENGAQALSVFRSNPVHLILLDVMMPLMDGFTTCKEIRKTSSVPIIFLTAKGEEEDKLLGFEMGTDHYVTKPFNMKILIAMVKSLLNRVYNLNAKEKKEHLYDGLFVDELSHKVTLNGTSLNLSPKEYDLLIYFIANEGIVLSREKLLNYIWGYDFEGDLRTVDTHIKRLREKLGEKAFLISTVRGTGYRFEGTNEK